MISQKRTALLLAAAMTAGLVMSCASAEPGISETSNNVSDTADETTEPGIEPLPDRDLAGFTISMGKPVQDKILWSNVSFATGEANGEILNDAIYSRNVKTAEKYNFKLTETELENPKASLEKQCMSGDSDYDVFLVPLQNLSGTEVRELLVDFSSVPFLTLDGRWWDQDMLRDLGTGSGQFFMNGDIIFSVYDCLRVIMYSKGLAEDLGLVGFYDMVRNGEWTVDRLYEMMTVAAVDMNSDGAMDYNDVFGILFNNNSYAAYINSQGVKLIDGGEIACYSERFVSAYENVLKVFDKALAFNYNEDKYPGLTARQAIVTMFDNRQALFFENGMSAASQYMRDIKNVDFGFLPLPKLDAEQERYYSYVSPSAPVLTIPKTNSDRLSDTGFILEALCRESCESVVPVYFDTCFSAKYTRDAESYEMILLATESRMYDQGYIYDYGKIGSTVTAAAKVGDESIMSKLDSIKDTVISELNSVR